ncbi:hypothetical protein OG21DRAFT_1490499 [Imleria badia]|nr:hypothetical protein OG21DRAFT_1490499 [Imleria badia]
MAFLVSHTREDDLRNQISPYFRDLFDLVNDWWKVAVKNISRDQVMTFSEVIPIFDWFLATMPDENPPEMAPSLQGLISDHMNLTSTITLPAVTLATPQPLTSQKHLSDNVRSMDNAQCNPPPPPPYEPSLLTPHAGISTALSTPAPVFHQRVSDSERFSFHVPSIQPPPFIPDAERPDLQAINNAYVAAAQKETLNYQAPLPQPCQEHPSMLVIPNVLGNEAFKSRPLYGSQAFRSVPTDVSHHQIDPTILSTLQTHLHNPPASQFHGVSHDTSDLTTEASSSDLEDEHRSEDSDGEDGGDWNVDGDESVSWGTTHQQQSIHPGFSQELCPQDPIHHKSFPTEPDFKYLHDEADNVAMAALLQSNVPLSEQSQSGAQTNNLSTPLNQEPSIVQSQTATHWELNLM